MHIGEEVLKAFWGLHSVCDLLPVHESRGRERTGLAFAGWAYDALPIQLVPSQTH